MKLLRKIVLMLLVLGAGVPALAADIQPAGRVLVYISPQEYTHDIKLWHFYYSYWFNQGSVIEPIALETLRPVFADVGMCSGNKASDMVVWIKPRMFYNPHMTVYYGSILANVYSGSGKFLGAYKGEAQRNGFLDVKPAQQISAAYRGALQDMVRKMQADGALQTLAMQGLAANETAMPCSMVAILPLKN